MQKFIKDRIHTRSRQKTYRSKQKSQAKRIEVYISLDTYEKLLSGMEMTRSSRQVFIENGIMLAFTSATGASNNKSKNVINKTALEFTSSHLTYEALLCVVKEKDTIIERHEYWANNMHAIKNAMEKEISNLKREVEHLRKFSKSQSSPVVILEDQLLSQID